MKKFYNLLLATLGLSFYIIEEFVQNMFIRKISVSIVLVIFMLVFLLSLRNDKSHNTKLSIKWRIYKIAVIVFTGLFVIVNLCIDTTEIRRIISIIIGCLLFVSCLLLIYREKKEF